MSAQNLLHDSKQNKYKKRFLLLLSNFFSTQNIVWLHFNWKHRIENKESPLQKYACFDSQSEITSKSHSAPLSNVLATGEFRLGAAIQNPKKNLN